MKYFSKSKYMLGLQCHKLLWISTNKFELIPDVSSSTQARFDVGKFVGDLATKLFDNGIQVCSDYRKIKENIEETKSSLGMKKPIFEAGFEYKGLYSRADILAPNKDGSWDVIEVKSSSTVKDAHIEDLAFQKYVYENSGINVKDYYVMHINSKYVKNGEIDLTELFTKTNVNSRVEEAIVGIEERIKKMLEIIEGPMPEIDIGDYCNSPYECALKSELCWKFLPENNVFSLSSGGEKSWSLYKSGIYSLKDIPEDFKLTEKQQIQRDCAISGSLHFDKNKISKFLDELEYPIYYFDFETVGSAVPIYDGTRPFQAIPFQYSLHIQEVENGPLKHISFIAETGKDPRNSIINEMKKDLGGKGTILAWSQGFEKGVIKDLVEFNSDIEVWADKILLRFNDLLIPFKRFNYYSSSQNGSASLKDVLPAITNMSYKGLEIANGSDASGAYLKLCTGNVSEPEKKVILKQLEKYCELDTLAEVKILEKLIAMSKE